jgi:hypothetical protein
VASSAAALLFSLALGCIAMTFNLFVPGRQAGAVENADAALLRRRFALGVCSF